VDRYAATAASTLLAMATPALRRDAAMSVNRKYFTAHLRED
jgi:hypothetical protein